jgi:hypothetical protein
MMRFISLAIAALGFIPPSSAQVPTDSVSKLYLSACHTGLVDAQKELLDVPQKDAFLRRGDERCDKSLDRFAAARDPHLQSDAGLLACSLGVHAMFEISGLEAELTSPSERPAHAYNDCMADLWGENLLSPDHQTLFAPNMVRRFLRFLLLAEEAFYGDSVRYTEHVTALDLKVPLSVRASVGLIGDGYRATAIHSSGLSCHIFVGTQVGAPSRKEGEPWCDQ